MNTLQPTVKTRNNEEQHRVRLRAELRALLYSKPIRRRLVLAAQSWEDGNKAATISEAQDRANRSGQPFTVFSVGDGVYGIIPSDSYRASYGKVVAVVNPQKK